MAPGKKKAGAPFGNQNRKGVLKPGENLRVELFLSKDDVALARAWLQETGKEVSLLAVRSLAREWVQEGLKRINTELDTINRTDINRLLGAIETKLKEKEENK